MSNIFIFFAGAMLGGVIGVFAMCAMWTAKEADEREERWHDDERRSN